MPRRFISAAVLAILACAPSQPGQLALDQSALVSARTALVGVRWRDDGSAKIEFVSLKQMPFVARSFEAGKRAVQILEPKSRAVLAQVPVPSPRMVGLSGTGDLDPIENLVLLRVPYVSGNELVRLGNLEAEGFHELAVRAMGEGDGN